MVPEYKEPLPLSQAISDYTIEDRSTSALLGLLLNRLGGELLSHLAAAGFPDARPGHGNVMGHLIQNDGLRLTTLAERAGITPQSMGELVDTLERLGYVERRPDPADRRAKLIFMSSKGRAGAAASSVAVAAQERRLRTMVGEADYLRLRATITTIIESWSTEPPPGVSQPRSKARRRTAAQSS